MRIKSKGDKMKNTKETQAFKHTSIIASVVCLTVFIWLSLINKDAVNSNFSFIPTLIIFTAMSIVFFMYYRLTKSNTKQLEKANAEAVKARKEAEQANMAKSSFLSSVSHDIRTPMNAVIGMTEIALKNLDDTNRTKECLDNIKISGLHLLNLINDVLDMSKIESGKMVLNETPISLHNAMDSIAGIIQPQTKEKNLSFHISVQEILSEWVYCDSVRLNQILLNLLSNAVKFTPEKGKISIYLNQEASPKGDKYIRTHFLVTDTGIGMSHEFQKKIWDAFTREETKKTQNIMGTGLGMSITKRITDIMGGSIELDSKPGEGSSFHITLDLKKAEESIKKQFEYNSFEDYRECLKGKRILLAEDIDINWEIVNEILSETGLILERVSDGKECIEKFENSYIGYYDAILMDIRMPVMNGYDSAKAIRALKRSDSNLPIIAMTADAFSDDILRCIKSGMNDHIAKPVYIEECISKLYKHLKC